MKSRSTIPACNCRSQQDFPLAATRVQVAARIVRVPMQSLQAAIRPAPQLESLEAMILSTERLAPAGAAEMRQLFLEHLAAPKTWSAIGRPKRGYNMGPTAGVPTVGTQPVGQTLKSTFWAPNRRHHHQQVQLAVPLPGSASALAYLHACSHAQCPHKTQNNTPQEHTHTRNFEHARPQP